MSAPYRVTAPRCTRCFKKVDENPHVVHLCVADVPEKKPRKPKNPDAVPRRRRSYA